MKTNRHIAKRKRAIAAIIKRWDGPPEWGHDFVNRAIVSALKALEGPRGGSRALMIARRIDHLRSDRSDTSSPREAIEAMIKDEEAWIPFALLEAAENGTLGEIADALKNLRRDGDPIFNPGRYNVLKAYVSLLEFGAPPPTVGELMIKLRARHANNAVPDVRVIRDMLKRLDLPLMADKRGRPSGKKIRK